MTKNLLGPKYPGITEKQKIVRIQSEVVSIEVPDEKGEQAGASLEIPEETAQPSSNSGEWIAPPEADNLKNLFAGNAAATAEGKRNYMTMCNICHGDKGKGDGVAGVALIPKPGNFTSEKVQSQSDGAIFWKMTNGRPPMAAYKDILTEEQLWQLVNYIRALGNKK